MTITKFSIKKFIAWVILLFVLVPFNSKISAQAIVCDPLPEDPDLLLQCNDYAIDNPQKSPPAPGSYSNPVDFSSLGANQAGWIWAAYSPKSDSLLLVTQKSYGPYSDKVGSATYTEIIGVFADPKTLQLKGSPFRIDSDVNNWHSLPKVAYSPDEDKFLVAWEDSRPCGKNCRSIRGRLVSGDGKPIGASDFHIDNAGFLADIIYDWRNKRFVVSYDLEVVFFRTVDLQGTVSPEVIVSNTFPYQGQSGISYNSNKDEYWAAYATVYTKEGADTAREDDRIFFSRVDAKTLTVVGEPIQLSKTRLGRLALQAGHIAYSEADGAAVAIWLERGKDGHAAGTWGRTIYDDGTMSAEYPVITPGNNSFSYAFASGIIAYNPWTRSFFVSSGDWEGNGWITEIDATGLVYEHELTFTVKLSAAKNWIAKLLGIKSAFAADPGNYNLTMAITPYGAVSFSSQTYARLVGSIYNSPNAASGPYPATPSPSAPLPPPGEVDVTALPKLVNQLYVWGLGVSVLLALLMLVLGGYHILTAGGNAEQATKGKEYITSALIGIVIIFTAYLLLNEINPDLVKFNLDSLGGLRR